MSAMTFEIPPAIADLADANRLRDRVHAINLLRKELWREPTTETVVIDIELLAQAIQRSDDPLAVETQVDINPALQQRAPIVVHVAPGYPPQWVRACLDQLAAEYESSFDHLTAEAAQTARAVMGDDEYPSPF